MGGKHRMSRLLFANMCSLSVFKEEIDVFSSRATMKFVASLMIPGVTSHTPVFPNLANSDVLPTISSATDAARRFPRL